MDFYRRVQQRAGKQLKLTAYFIAFPNWVIVQNISFFILILFYHTSSKHYVRGFTIRSIMSFVALLVFVGATCSAIGAGIKYGSDYFYYSFKLLPNYLYWATTVIFIGNLALQFLSLQDLYKSFFWGLISLIFTYFLFDPIFELIPFYNGASDNSFAFLLILFSPMATAYVQQTRKNLPLTFIFILFVTIIGFLSGSRSGSLLTLAGSLLVISIETWGRTVITLFSILFLVVAAPYLKESQSIKQAIFGLNERTYNIIYETDETLNTDFSYLTRLAMVEKGLELFSQNPITGVGIGNFGKTKVDLDFEFEGGELIAHKDEILETGVSAHNSYISILAEGGLLLFLPFIFLMLYPTVYFFSNFNSINTYEKAIFISIIFMCIHAWFISAMLNIFGWFVLGIANSYIIHKNQLQVK